MHSLLPWSGSHGWLPLLWLVPAGLLAGAVNTAAGGGSFVTVAALLALGLPAPVANASNRVGVLVQSAWGAGRFRARGVDGGGELWAQILVSGAGAGLGAALSLWLDPKRFDQVLAVAMIVMLGVSLARPRSWLEPGRPRPVRWLALFAAGAYGGFLQAGVGVLLLPALVVFGGLDPVRANARKVLLVAAFTVPPLVMYAAAGLVDWLAGGVLALSSAVGATLGVRLTVGYGPRFVYAVLVLVVVANLVRMVATSG
ncbi:MAG: sulfite exporter TauE/SafE family protein [Myxococcota bacterium]